MIWLIAKKDFLLNLTSPRFIIGFILCLVIIPFTMLVSIDGYRNQMRIHEVDVKEQAEIWNTIRVYSAVRPTIIKEPEALSIFTQGIQGNMGSSVLIEFGEYPTLLTGHAGTRDNPLLNAFFSIDFTTVIAILMSLLALVFSYDLFTREKEDGTLKLVFTNSLSRTSFLSGKFLGILITLLPILLFCFILSIILILAAPDISFSSTDWIGIILIFFTSTIYLMLFILMGMLISALSKSSSVSIVVSLLIWIWMLFLVPDIAYYSSQSIYKVPTYDNVRYSLDELDREFEKATDEKWTSITREMKLDGVGHWNWNGGGDGYDEMYGCTYETYEFHKRLNEWREPMRISYADKKWSYQKSWLDALAKQERIRQVLSWLSPSEIFSQISSNLSRTSSGTYLTYMEKVREYRETLIQYFKQKSLFNSCIYFTQQDPKTFVKQADLEALAASGQIDWEHFKVPANWEPRYYKPLDLSDVPQFTYTTATSGETLKQSIGLLIGLLLPGIIFLSAIVYIFMKYDVR